MTDEKQSDEARKLGDLLAPGSDWLDRSAVEPPDRTALAWNPAPLEKVLVWLAQQYGEDPESVLKDVRGNTALARTVRKALGHADMSRDLRTYLMLESLGDDMTAAEKHVLISDFLKTERDAVGNRLGGAEPESVQRAGRRGRGEFKKIEKVEAIRRIADMFGQQTEDN